MMRTGEKEKKSKTKEDPIPRQQPPRGRTSATWSREPEPDVPQHQRRRNDKPTVVPLIGQVEESGPETDGFLIVVNEMARAMMTKPTYRHGGFTEEERNERRAEIHASIRAQLAMRKAASAVKKEETGTAASSSEKPAKEKKASVLKRIVSIIRPSSKSTSTSDAAAVPPVVASTSLPDPAATVASADDDLDVISLRRGATSRASKRSASSADILEESDAPAKKGKAGERTSTAVAGPAPQAVFGDDGDIDMTSPEKAIVINDTVVRPDVRTGVTPFMQNMTMVDVEIPGTSGTRNQSALSPHGLLNPGKTGGSAWNCWTNSFVQGVRGSPLAEFVLSYDGNDQVLLSLKDLLTPTSQSKDVTDLMELLNPALVHQYKEPEFFWQRLLEGIKDEEARQGLEGEFQFESIARHVCNSCYFPVEEESELNAENKNFLEIERPKVNSATLDEVIRLAFDRVDPDFEGGECGYCLSEDGVYNSRLTITPGRSTLILHLQDNFFRRDGQFDLQNLNEAVIINGHEWRATSAIEFRSGIDSHITGGVGHFVTYLRAGNEWTLFDDYRSPRLVPGFGTSCLASKIDDSQICTVFMAKVTTDEPTAMITIEPPIAKPRIMSLQRVSDASTSKVDESNTLDDKPSASTSVQAPIPMPRTLFQRTVDSDIQASEDRPASSFGNDATRLQEQFIEISDDIADVAPVDSLDEEEEEADSASSDTTLLADIEQMAKEYGDNLVSMTPDFIANEIRHMNDRTDNQGVAGAAVDELFCNKCQKLIIKRGERLASKKWQADIAEHYSQEHKGECRFRCLICFSYTSNSCSGIDNHVRRHNSSLERVQDYYEDYLTTQWSLPELRRLTAVLFGSDNVIFKFMPLEWKEKRRRYLMKIASHKRYDLAPLLTGDSNDRIMCLQCATLILFSEKAIFDEVVRHLSIEFEMMFGKTRCYCKFVDPNGQRCSHKSVSTDIWRHCAKRHGDKNCWEDRILEWKRGEVEKASEGVFGNSRFILDYMPDSWKAQYLSTEEQDTVKTLLSISIRRYGIRSYSGQAKVERIQFEYAKKELIDMGIGKDQSLAESKKTATSPYCYIVVDNSCMPKRREDTHEGHLLQGGIYAGSSENEDDECRIKEHVTETKTAIWKLAAKQGRISAIEAAKQLIYDRKQKVRAGKKVRAMLGVAIRKESLLVLRVACSTTESMQAAEASLIELLYGIRGANSTSGTWPKSTRKWTDDEKKAFSYVWLRKMVEAAKNPNCWSEIKWDDIVREPARDRDYDSIEKARAVAWAERQKMKRENLKILASELVQAAISKGDDVDRKNNAKFEDGSRGVVYIFFDEEMLTTHQRPNDGTMSEVLSELETADDALIYTGCTWNEDGVRIGTHLGNVRRYHRTGERSPSGEVYDIMLEKAKQGRSLVIIQLEGFNRTTCAAAEALLIDAIGSRSGNGRSGTFPDAMRAGLAPDDERAYQLYLVDRILKAIKSRDFARIITPQELTHQPLRKTGFKL